MSDKSASNAVEAAYAVILGRKPDDAGRRFWENSLKTGKVSAYALPGRFLGLSEAETSFRTATTPTAKLTKFYRNALCRTPKPAELSYWSDQLPRASISSVALKIGSSSEAKNKRAWTTKGKPICR